MTCNVSSETLNSTQLCGGVQYKQSSAELDGGSTDAARSNTGHHPRSSSSSSAALYKVELHRGSRGFGFAIRGGREFAGMPICVLNIASGGSADVDGRLRVYESRLIYDVTIYESFVLANSSADIHNEVNTRIFKVQKET